MLAEHSTHFLISQVSSLESTWAQLGSLLWSHSAKVKLSTSWALTCFHDTFRLLTEPKSLWLRSPFFWLPVSWSHSKLLDATYILHHLAPSIIQSLCPGSPLCPLLCDLLPPGREGSLVFKTHLNRLGPPR